MKMAWYNKDMDKRNGRSGFTLVELSLSIVFISILSVAVALIISNAISAYHRGVIMNQVNTTGMDLVDDVRSVVQASPSGMVAGLCNGLEEGKDDCVADGGSKFVSVTVKGKVGEMENVPLYGAFCTGLYSYVWNSGYFFNEEFEVADGGKTPLKLEYKIAGESGIKTAENFK